MVRSAAISVSRPRGGIQAGVVRVSFIYEYVQRPVVLTRDRETRRAISLHARPADVFDHVASAAHVGPEGTVVHGSDSLVRPAMRCDFVPRRCDGTHHVGAPARQPTEDEERRRRLMLSE